jgi:hypothetical protein
MRTSNPRTSTGAAKSEAERPPLKRFRIEKLEERIAPSKGGKGTHNCGGGGGSGASSGLSSGSIF